MTDVIERKTRGRMAIAITDAIQALGLRPLSVILVGLRGLFRLDLPTSASDLVRQVGTARRNTAMTLGCVGILGILILPILLPIEMVRGARVRRHNQAMRDQLARGALREVLSGADTVLAVDWTIWRDGALCFAGTALCTVRGDENLPVWITVHRGPPPRDAIDAAALAKAISDIGIVTTRWEWELQDPFEAVERA